jgi:hypothetical protein
MTPQVLNRQQRRTDISIHGFLVGDIWMPMTECWKDLFYNITSEDERWSEPGTLREHVCRATNDGDFRSAAIAQGELVVTIRREAPQGTLTRSRSFPLSMFPSVRDMLHDDPDWFPPCDEGD